MEGVLKTVPTPLVVTTVPAIRAMFLEVMGMPAMVRSGRVKLLTGIDDHLSDVNECLTANGGCQQLCNNTVGSFFCACHIGYSLQLNGFNCSGKIFKHIHFYVGDVHSSHLQMSMSAMEITVVL